jgi:YebC/PmpR family DNA-binding regulatory protein
MSGHSKWSQIKRQKGAADQKRGAIFTKLSREITIAAKQGGGDPDANFRLRLAVQKAREANMPADNIQRAIAKATGGGEGNDLHEITYEGYGPGGVAILVEAATDNRNRTVGEVRSVLTRAGGSLGETGSVAWQFESRGVVSAETGGRDEDAIAEAVIESGAEDYSIDADTVDVYTQPADLEAVRGALIEAGLTVTSSELSYVTKTPVMLEAKDAEQVLRLLEKLEDLDDVQRVYSNAEFSEEAIAAFSV